MLNDRPTNSETSPIELVTILTATPAAAGTLWVFTQAFEKFANFRLDREILKLQRDKLKKELNEAGTGAPRGIEDSDDELREQLRIHEAEYHLDRLERRLHESPVRITEIEITYLRELHAKGNSESEEST